MKGLKFPYRCWLLVGLLSSTGVCAQQIGSEGRDFMRRGQLAMQLKNEPRWFFEHYIEDRYTAHDGLKPLKINLVNVVQILDESSMLGSNKRGDIFLVRMIDTSDMIDDQYINVILVRDGNFEYVSVLGAGKRVRAYYPGQPMTYFVSLVRAAETGKLR